jgi:hypothetical protein
MFLVVLLLVVILVVTAVVVWWLLGDGGLQVLMHGFAGTGMTRPPGSSNARLDFYPR